ncbi:40s ribosomal protein s11 [Lynx pardinus]|uniref:40s ribosomal protein s11 n=1 Tax=Lynx pardinus TaxID=191816 RepID=A0A485PXW2_LYNPA|nr:40s ribosomal protein s11 [Lynx pardinus]
MADIQTESAYQKQLTIFQNRKRVLLGDSGKKKLPQYDKHIGLGFKTLKAFKGQIVSGVVTKMKTQKTTVIHQDYFHYI